MDKDNKDEPTGNYCQNLQLSVHLYSDHYLNTLILCAQQ